MACGRVELAKVEAVAGRRLRHHSHTPQPNTTPTAALSSSSPSLEAEAAGRAGGDSSAERLGPVRAAGDMAGDAADSGCMEEAEAVQSESSSTTPSRAAAAHSVDRGTHSGRRLKRLSPHGNGLPAGKQIGWMRPALEARGQSG